MTALVKLNVVTREAYERTDAMKIEHIVLDFMAFCRFLFGQKFPY